MKKINKDKILSGNYEKFLKTLEGKEHPPYNSSEKKEYYMDIKMSLLYCQNGLCAYTEEVLCDPKFLALQNWDNDKYIKDLTQLEKGFIEGDLDHFDESLKSDYAFLWENLFVVKTHNNCRIKGTKSIIHNILKPDAEDYDPSKYLEFNFDMGVFIPNIHLSDKEKIDVKYMIDTLGLNCVDYQRKRQLEEWRDRYEMGLAVNPHRFITAWNMTLQSMHG